MDKVYVDSDYLVKHQTSAAGMIICSVFAIAGVFVLALFSVTFFKNPSTKGFLVYLPISLIFGFLFVYFFGLRIIISEVRSIRLIKNGEFSIIVDSVVDFEKHCGHGDDPDSYFAELKWYTPKTGKLLRCTWKDYKYTKTGEKCILVFTSKSKTPVQSIFGNKFELGDDLRTKVYSDISFND